MNRVLLVDSVAAAAGGRASSSSNTTFIESAAGISEGGRTGLTSVVVGVLFLLAIFFSPLAGVIPPEATAPVLVIVGYLMMQAVGEISWRDPAVGDPRAAHDRDDAVHVLHHERRRRGIPSYVVIKVLQGKFREVHPLMYVIAAVFAWYFFHGLLA